MGMNKKGDVSITILVIGIFAACTLAVISFLISQNSMQSNFSDMGTVENASVQLDNFYFYVNSGMTYEQAAKEIGANIKGNKLIINSETKGVVSVQYRIDLNK